jgi:hypothetical protein
MPRGKAFGPNRADEEGNWIASESAFSGVFAGNDHEVLVSCFQDEGVMTAVAPTGMPVTVNVTGVGKIVPAVGATVRG